LSHASTNQTLPRVPTPLLQLGLCLAVATISLTTLSSPATLSAGEPAIAFYVAPDGDDANTGTIASPFATLDRARLAVRALLTTGVDQDVYVYLRGGTYFISEPVTFDTADSAPAGHVVEHTSFPGERAVISGGRPIDNWTVQIDGTWTTTIPDVAAGEWTFRELFVNGQRRPRARHPNIGYLTADGPDPSVGSNTRTVFRYAPGDLPTDSNLAGAECNMLHEWTMSRVRIDQVNHTTRAVTTAEPLGAFGLITSIFQITDHPRYALENHPSLLDSPGEWYLDNATGLLTYWPKPGEFIETVNAIAPVATELIVVRGNFATGDPVANLRFTNLSFEHAAWALPPGGYSSYQSGYYEQRGLPTYELPAAVKFEVAENCHLERIRVAHCGGWGVMLGAWCRGCSLVGSTITDIAGNGVIVGEDRYRRVNGIFWVENYEEQAATNNTVLSNLVQDCGVVFQDCAGIWAGLTIGSSIQNNLLRRLPHIGVSTGGYWDDSERPCGGMTIADNRFQNVVQLLSDGGAIYSVGLQPDSIFRGNLISGIPAAPGLSRNPAIYLDQGSTGFTIEDNGIYGVASSPFKFHLAGSNTLISNTMRLASESVVPYFLQSTDANDITRIDDVIINPTNPPAGCTPPVCGEASTAGLLPMYLSDIFVDTDGDGIADIDDSCPQRRPGDANGDGRLDGNDIQTLVALMLDQSTDSAAFCAMDVTFSGNITAADAIVFVSLVLNQ